ncbi:MAG: LacI family transcriptional regulator [Candidatus Viridilinea halotolerans]|uniref:LacI family transcriptional regulator n=1 Tax=Candidatus Viridilinea halotolerans TaxID=2491704 RepID=A0A426TWY9_9CHLR|nr:MAG: LacI family transcriptional regulator [Candidatus Viridilinea halotolerans]
MATIKDVAAQAHVSTATVSYVLNGTGAVTAATRRRVLEAVAALDYQPNHAARSMRTRSRTLGLILPPGPNGLADPALAELVAGLSSGAAAADHYLLLAPSSAQLEQELGAQLVRSGRVDGLILLDLRVDDERVVSLTSAGVPCVAAGCPLPSCPCPSVGLDYSGGATAATRHLVALGHQRVALIALPSDFADSEPFVQGFANALAAAGLHVDPALVIEANNTHADGVAATQELLTNPDPPSAILAASDTLAFGALHALHDAGVHVGRTMALVGCGDLPLAAHAHPPLTTLRTPRHALGVALAQRLIARIEQRELPPSPLLGLKLMVRHSTLGGYGGKPGLPPYPRLHEG